MKWRRDYWNGLLLSVSQSVRLFTSRQTPGIFCGYAICTAVFIEARARVDWYYGVKKVLVGLTPKIYYDNGSIVTSERLFYKYMYDRP